MKENKCQLCGLKKMEDLEKKYNFDKFDATTQMMGITHNQVENEYGGIVDA